MGEQVKNNRKILLRITGFVAIVLSFFMFAFAFFDMCVNGFVLNIISTFFDQAWNMGLIGTIFYICYFISTMIIKLVNGIRFIIYSNIAYDDEFKLKRCMQNSITLLLFASPIEGIIGIIASRKKNNINRGTLTISNAELKLRDTINDLELKILKLKKAKIDGLATDEQYAKLMSFYEDELHILKKKIGE